MPDETNEVTQVDVQPQQPEDQKIKRLRKKRTRVPIEIEEENGEVKLYHVVEMTGSVRDIWMQSMSGRMRTDSSGKPTGVRDFKGLQASLIAACLTYEDRPVGIDEIQKWPSSTQKELFDICQRINGLSELGVEEAKKD